MASPLPSAGQGHLRSHTLLPLPSAALPAQPSCSFFWCPLNNGDNKVLGSCDGTQCPQAGPMLCEELQLICTQQSMLLLLFCCSAHHMQIAFPKAEPGTCPQLPGLCPPLKDTILSLGFFHEAGKTQVLPNDRHLTPQKRRDLDSYIKSQVDVKALLCSSRIWFNSPLAAFSTSLNPLPDVSQSCLQPSFPLCQGFRHPLAQRCLFTLPG